jgi:putative pyruvate formate lyase activating enzyme
LVDVLLYDNLGEFDGGLRHALQDYFKVASNLKPSRMRVASSIPAENSNDMDVLWREHNKLRAKYGPKYIKTSWNEMSRPEFSYFDLKIKITEKILESCVLCEKNCRVDRRSVTGSCRVSKPFIASEFLHMGEERVLVPSHTIFFSGCNFDCVYCQNWDISQHPDQGMVLEPDKLAKVIDLRRRHGSMNVNFVGGEPTPNLPYIFKTMKYSMENIPVVWNSNLYLSENAMKLLDGFADLYLTDFKYGNNVCAEELSGISNYVEVVRRNHKSAYKAGDMIIRHLIIPNHVECCSKPLLKWISDNLGSEVVLNIMPQYRPVYKALEHPDISVFPSQEEIQEVKSFAEGLGFVNLI